MEVEPMVRVTICECGQVIRGESADELAAKTEAHLDESHPELVGKLSSDDLEEE
jgi:predicted small metal-binding protein